MKKSLGTLLIATMLIGGSLILTGCGSQTNQQATNNNGSVAENKGATTTNKKFEGNYKFNPPTDNYYVEVKDEDGDVTITAKNGKLFTSLSRESDGTENIYHANEDTEKVYCKYEGKWYIDSYADYSEYEDEKNNVEPFYVMEEYFMKYFRAYGYEDSKLAEYYVGNETVAGVNCWVFDSKGLNGIQGKFWVDPSNGVTLKYASTAVDSDECVEAVNYNLNYTKMDEELAPSSYEGIESL